MLHAHTHIHHTSTSTQAHNTQAHNTKRKHHTTNTQRTQRTYNVYNAHTTTQRTHNVHTTYTQRKSPNYHPIQCSVLAGRGHANTVPPQTCSYGDTFDAFFLSLSLSLSLSLFLSLEIFIYFKIYFNKYICFFSPPLQVRGDEEIGGGHAQSPYAFEKQLDILHFLHTA